MTLSSDLTKLGLALAYAQTIESHYGNQTNFVVDMDHIAAALAYGMRPGGEPITSEPWHSIRDRIEAAIELSGATIEEAYQRGLEDIDDDDAQLAINELTVLRMSTILNTQPHGKIGSASPPGQSKRIKSIYLQPPDQNLVDSLRAAMRSRNLIDEERKSAIAAIAVNWLGDHGRFIRTPEGELFYLFRDEHRLYKMDTEPWRAWLYNLTALSPAGANFSTVDAACKTVSRLHGEETDVMRMAYYDLETQTLRVSRFDGTVFVLNGDEITEEANGDGPVLFEDSRLWESYTPDFSGTNYKLGSCLNWLTSSVPNWTKDPEKQSQGFRVWLLSTFFSELCPPKPLLAVLGEKGSGKSMTFRIALKLLYGNKAQISGVPDKPDGFIAAASHYHIYVLDNLDTMTVWLRDKLARITSGSIDEYRQLYTSNELGIVAYRCWIVVTARTPDTLRRDDLVDRLMIQEVARLPSNKRKAELAFLREASKIRDAWWGDVLTQLNRIVKELREGDTPTVSPLRLADWEILGRIISDVDNKAAEWHQVVKDLQKTQSTFIAEGDCVVEAIEAWLSKPLNSGKKISARDLYNEAKEALWPYPTRPDRNWPKSALWFGRRVSDVKEYLAMTHGFKSWRESSGMMYQFTGIPAII